MVLAALWCTNALPAGHCTTDEVTYFSCSIRNTDKVVSVCGSPFKDPATREVLDDAWLQFRFGKPGQPLELVFPARRTGSLRRFDGEYHHPAQGFYQALSFRHRSTFYSVEAVEADTTFFGLRATVGQKTAELPCRSHPEIQDREGGNNFGALVIELGGKP